MSLTTYNFFWGMVKFILPSYLVRRQKKGKEDIHRINERFGISKNNRPDGTLVWLHGTSVGESVAALALANSMSKNGYGINKKEFMKNINTMAEQALASGSPNNNPRIPSHEEIVELYEQLWH